MTALVLAAVGVARSAAERSEPLRNAILFTSVGMGLIFCLTASAEEASNAAPSFAGISFGVGISLTHDIGGDDRVKAATVENGIVRVTEDENDDARVMFESHYFFQPLRPVAECRRPKGKSRWTVRRTDPCQAARRKLVNNYSSEVRQDWGWGPFVALQAGTDEIIEAIGGGFMVGFKRDGDTNSSFNIGFGVVVDTSVTLLGDGFTANEKAPVDAEGKPLPVRLRDTDQVGALVLASFTF